LIFWSHHMNTCSDGIADVWCEMLWQCMIFQTAKVPKSAKISQHDILELQGMRCKNFFVQQKCSGVYAIYDGCICFLGCLPLPRLQWVSQYSCPCFCHHFVRPASIVLNHPSTPAKPSMQKSSGYYTSYNNMTNAMFALLQLLQVQMV